MAVFSTGYCKITGLSKAMPESHYIPIMPALSQSEQAQLFGCKITMAAHMEHNYVPIIEFGRGKGLGVVACKITGHQAESVARSVPLPEEGAEIKRVHRFKRDFRYMEPFVSRLANPGERAAMEDLLERMRRTSELDSAHYYVYALHDRRTGKTGMVLPYEYEEAIRSGAIESILLSGDSNSLVVRIKDGPMCTIPMDKVGKLQVERLSEEEMIFDGRGPDREIIENQRREKAAREKEDRDQMAEYLAEMERKRKERDMRKKEKMKETMKRKMEEAEEAERRQKEMDEEIKRQYEDAARIRAEAEAAKAAAREAMLAKREQKDAEARARRAEELAEQARLAEEKLQREEAERQAAEEARLAQEAAAAQALAAVDPHDMSVNELLEHMREKTEDEALLRDMEDAASIGMSSQQIADMVVTSTIEAIEEEFAEPEEEEEEVEEESEDEEEEKEKEDQLDAQAEEGEDEAEKEMLRQLREEQLEMKRKEREAKRLARQRKREEQELKDEEKRLKKDAREKKKREMMARMTAIHKADADEEAERMKKPEMREIKPRELLRRKRPENLEIPPPEEPAEYVVRTRDGKAVLTEDELDETSVIEGRISADATGQLTPGRAVKTQSGIEFVAGRIITTEGGEVFEPGQEIDLPVGPKFVPGQTVATAHGPQFVAGKTIGEGENVEFVPGHVVDLGEGKGEIFVPGQVMETDDGPKFIPGSVFRCRRAGPLFVPGQLREGEFLPGQIVETEDGPRFMSPKFPGREEQFSYVVQSFDLEQAELDLVKYQYHSPEPSPVFQGEDIGESINLMQLAARGYQAKTLPLPEQRPPPRKSKRQIYENVRVTFLDCIDSAERTRNAAAPRTLDKDELTVEARRVQRVLADDLNNPLPLTEVIGFLRKCLSLTTPTADIAGWIDGLFGHTEKGIFRPMERMRERKLSKKVSLQKTLAEIVQEMETELEEARKRDIVIVSLAKVMKKEPPLRTHVDDYRERWQEIISGILLTYGKVVLNDVFDVVAYRDADCVKTILDDVRERVASLAGDSAAVTALEHSICQYVQQNAEGRLEELFSATDDNAVPGRDGLTREILLSEGASLALLEDELDVSDCLRQCLATPALVSLLPLYHGAMEILRTLLNIHTLSTGDERRRSLLANLAKNPGFLYDSESWVTLVSGATLITQHVGIKPRRLRSANCVPDEAVALVAEFQSPEVDAVFRNVMLDASRHVHGLAPISRADVPVMVVKNQFEGILPRHLARDVIHGRLRYLLVNEKTVKLATVGQEEEEEEHIEKQSEDATCSTGDQEGGKTDVTELKLEDEEAKDTIPCEDECICDPEEPASSSRKESTVSLPRKSSTASVSRKASTASVSRKASTTNVSRKASTASERADVTASELEVDTTKDEKEDKTVDDTGKASGPEACLKEEQEQDASQTIVKINVHKADDVGEDAEDHVQEQTTPSGTEEHEEMDKQDAKQTDLEPTDPEAEILDGTERVACPVGDENEKVTTEEEKHEVDDSRGKDTAHEDEPTAPVDIAVDEEVGTDRATQDADKIKSECADAKEDIGEVRTDVAEIKEDNARIETDDTESKQEVDKIEISLAEVEAEIADNKLTLASPGV